MSKTVFEIVDNATKSLNDLLKPTQKSTTIFESQAHLSLFLEVQQPLKNLTSFVPDIFANLNTPLSIYHNELQGIARQIESINAPYTHLNEMMQSISDEINAAENNYFHRLCVEEMKDKIEAGAIEATTIKDRNTELEAQVKELEAALRATCRLIKPITEPRPPATLSLSPNITTIQISQLHEATKWLFASTTDQWRNLFSEDIKEFERPIVLCTQHIADVAILFYCLHEKRLIDSFKYALTLEKAKAFAFQGNIITSKQIRKFNEYDNHPNVGKNYHAIEAIVELL